MPLENNYPLYLGDTAIVNRNIRAEILGFTGPYNLVAALNAAGFPVVGGEFSDFFGYSHTLPPTASAPISFGLDSYVPADPTAGSGAYYLSWTNYTTWPAGSEPTQIWIQRRNDAGPWTDVLGLTYLPSKESHKAIVTCDNVTSITWRAYYSNSAGVSGNSNVSTPQVANC